MEALQAIVLGLVQGITEFLPISSSAHLILVPKLVQWPDQGLLFDIGVHVGTLIAVMLYFRKEVAMLICGGLNVLRGRCESAGAKLFLMLVVSTVPLVIVAPFIKSSVELYARSFTVIGVTSIVFGLLLWWADNRVKNCGNKELDVLTTKQAIIFGLFQVLAMVPGTSRSGICMTAGRLLGFSRSESSRFAMLMAMPVIFLIGSFSFISDFESGLSLADDWRELLIGASVSFVSALGAIHILMKFVERIGFVPFVIYRVVLGVVLLTIV